MKNMIALLMIVFGLFVLFGTAGAIETDGITIMQGVIRMAIVIPIMVTGLVLMKKMCGGGYR